VSGNWHNAASSALCLIARLRVSLRIEEQSRWGIYFISQVPCSGRFPVIPAIHVSAILGLEIPERVALSCDRFRHEPDLRLVWLWQPTLEEYRRLNVVAATVRNVRLAVERDSKMLLPSRTSVLRKRQSRFFGNAAIGFGPLGSGLVKSNTRGGQLTFAAI
jgi:hypothetical protein